jgi:hypothetical protein
MNLRASTHPEFDAWRWHEYWVPLESVIEFKRGVYEMALSELARFLPASRGPQNRYLRGNMRGNGGRSDRLVDGAMDGSIEVGLDSAREASAGEPSPEPQPADQRCGTT